MRCRFPPPLTDDQLSAAIDGQADEDVLRHLAQCDTCSARLAKVKQLEGFVHAQLQRWDCPPPQMLTLFHLNMLDSDDARPISEHLRICLACETEISDLRAFLGTPTGARTHSSPTFARRLRELVAQIVPSQPTMAMRGMTHGPILAQADGVTVALEIVPGNSGVDLTGQVASEDQDDWTGALIELRREADLLAITTVDDLGGFQLSALAPGRAVLRITPPNQQVVIHVADLDLGTPEIE